MFRLLSCQMTIADKPETFYFLEVKPDGFVGTNRLCETMDEAIYMQNEVGHGDDPSGLLHMTLSSRFLRMNSDRDTLEIFDPPQ